MTIPPSESLPSAGFELPPARKRRLQRQILNQYGEQAESGSPIRELVQRATPSLEFFLFTLLAGLVLIGAMLLDSPALFVLAALLAPFLAPVVGLGLAASAGSSRFFVKSLMSTLIASAILFGSGALAGWLAKLFRVTSADQSAYHAVFTWWDGLLLLIGVILTAILFSRPRNQRPLVTSAAIAYELFLPISVAGYGLVSGNAALWPDGLLVFLVHLAVSILVMAIVFSRKGLKLKATFGYTLATTLILLGIVALVMFGGFFTAVSTNTAFLPTSTSTPGPTATITDTPIPPTQTCTPTNTLIPTSTSTATITPQPTLVEAKIHAEESNGAKIRVEPGLSSPLLTTALNGYLVYVLPETAEMDGYTWVHILLTDGREGWIVRLFLQTATPQPSW